MAYKQHAEYPNWKAANEANEEAEFTAHLVAIGALPVTKAALLERLRLARDHELAILRSMIERLPN